MFVPAPGRLTTVTGCLSESCMCSASKRAIVSVLPPAVNGTTICSGRIGKSAAAIDGEAANKMPTVIASIDGIPIAGSPALERGVIVMRHKPLDAVILRPRALGSALRAVRAQAPRADPVIHNPRPWGYARTWDPLHRLGLWIPGSLASRLCRFASAPEGRRRRDATS